MKNIHLFVEGEIDKIIINNILSAAQYPLNRVSIEVAGGKSNVVKFAKNAAKLSNQTQIIAALVDADTIYIQDAIVETQKQFANTNVEVFVTVPQIEAWLFADDFLIKKYGNKEQTKQIARLPLPQEITYPKEIYQNFLRKKNAYGLADEYAFLLEMNIGRATMRCPSLSHFLRKIADLLHISTDITTPIENTSSNILPKHIFSNLIQEVANANTVIFRTLSGYSITADDMQKAVLQDSPEGKEYISNVLRVARDIIRMQSQKTEISPK